jgi:hypothetical protein
VNFKRIKLCNAGKLRQKYAGPFSIIGAQQALAAIDSNCCGRFLSPDLAQSSDAIFNNKIELE